MFFSLHFFSVVVSASVPESTEDYFCKEETQVLKSEHASTATGCEQTWAAESIVRHKCYNLNDHLRIF